MSSEVLTGSPLAQFAIDRVLRTERILASGIGQLTILNDYVKVKGMCGGRLVVK